MASWRKYAGGKTLTAKSLGKKKITGKIVDVTVEQLKGVNGEMSEKICLQIEDERKLVPMNVGNCTRLGDEYGEDFDEWIGKPVIVSVCKTHFGEKEVDGLFVEPMTAKRKK